MSDQTFIVARTLEYKSMLHTAVITIMSLAASTMYWTGYALDQAVIITILGCAVAVVGLPHGGLDHHVGRSLFSRLLGEGTQLSFIGFYVSYVGLAAAIVLGWYIAPTITILLFFAVASWHFGLEEEPAGKLASALSHIGIAARGGMVIWCCCVFRGLEVAGLLDVIVPGDSASGVEIASMIGGLWPLFACLLFADSLRVSLRITWKKFLQHSMRTAALVLLFATCPVLLSFAVYFCGWHSIKGLVHLREHFSGTNREFAVALVPMSVLAIALFAASVGYYATNLTIGDAAIRTIFIGLSAVAVPHLVLHIVDDSIRCRSTSMAAATHGGVTCPT